MYDNIVLTMPYPFISEQAKDVFCKRFEMNVIDEKKCIYQNSTYEGKKQNRGLRMKMQPNSINNNDGYLNISFSLHKFYNYPRKNKAVNYDDFTFVQANKAYDELLAMLPFDLSTAKVKQYEIGINIVLNEQPECYTKELVSMTVNNKTAESEIMQDPRYKEYKQYSTRRDRHTRSFYVFYDKTHETRERAKIDLSVNILRIEKKVKRLNKKVTFSELFTPIFQKMLYDDFFNRISNIKYRTYTIRPKNMTVLQLEAWEQIRTKGLRGAKEHYKRSYELQRISKNIYKSALKRIKKVTEDDINPIVHLSQNSKELQNEIKNKSNTLTI